MERIVATRRQGYMHELAMGEHAITVDEPLENGGTDRGPSPQDLLAGSLAACTAATVELYADRKGWDVGPLTVSVEISGTLVRGVENSVS
jgi:putative redox protein